MVVEKIMGKFLLAAALLTSLSSFATENDAELLNKIDRLENQILALESKQSAGSIAPVSENNASIHSRLLELEEKMRDLNGKFDTVDHQVQQLTQKVQNLATDVDLRFNQHKPVSPPVESTSTAVVTAPAPIASLTPAPVEFKQQSAPGDDLADQLTKYNEMIGSGEYKKALAGLEKFVVEHKVNEKSGEAYYLMGLAYSKQKLNDKAAINYLKSYKNYPGNVKAADSLLRLSSALTQLNKKTKACEILNKLETEYPGRSDANKQKSAEAMDKLKCKTS